MTSLYFYILTFKFFGTNKCHMLKAQPSTDDMFALIELYGRKVQSVFGSVEILHTIPIPIF